MKIDGRCYCGFLTYEAEIDPAEVAICHCTDCQAFSGSAFRTVVPAREADFKLLSGAPKVFIKTAASGNKRQQVFCPECGTQIYATSAGEGPKFFGLRVGTIRQRDQLVPRTQYWTRSAQPWVKKLDSMTSFETED